MPYNPDQAAVDPQPIPQKTELAIVIPVYNEEQNLRALFRDWQPVFKASGASYRIIAIDDGSADDSVRLLQSLQSENPVISIHTQPNSGHGAAILKGYRLALDAEWVFQMDSDHQLDTGAFVRLWANRNDYDLLIAQRADRNASKGRRWISRFSTGMVRMLYGRGVTDVNSPYRLMRSQVLRSALEKIPAGSFAPNVLLTSWFILKKRRIFTTTVELRNDGLRRSRLNRYFLRGSFRSCIQTILFRIR
ncbi:MAG TPA: glycosyltransferase family 2 protein [Puia sp.]|jgi:glycosyltransferase involved in cell wall biosynthesis|nr:glycosyltransferase family 2 protein [Puia sp.]